MLDTDDVIVAVKAKHLCVSSRGIKDKIAQPPIEYGGVFNDENMRGEFLIFSIINPKS